jgi:thiosulfate sulfurtransferase
MSDTFKRITPEEAQQMREQGAVFVDIRDPNSYSAGHIEGAARLDNQNLGDFIASADLDHPLVVVCYHGHSSQGAAAYLVGQGFSEVFSMDGGFEHWNSLYPQYVSRSES